MSQISKCPKVTVILSYWEASGEVSKLRNRSLLYCKLGSHENFKISSFESVQSAMEMYLKLMANNTAK